MNLKKDYKGTRAILDDTKSLLEQTEFVLTNTQQSLVEEALLQRAYKQIEEQLNTVRNELIATLSKTVNNIGGLYLKLYRRLNL